MQLRSLSIIHKYLLSSVCRAVVSKYGSGARDPAALVNTENVYNGGRMRCLNSKITITNGDDIASIYRFGAIPSNAIIDPQSFLDYYAATGVTSFDLGFYYPNGGAVIDANNLVAALDIHLAGTGTLRSIGTLTLANSNKRVWELAGLSADPGGNIDIVGTINAAATATGVVNLTLRYSVN